MRSLFLICAGFCSATAFSQGQTAATASEIRVRLLDYKTGRPLQGRYVWLTLFNSEEQYRNKAVVAMEGKTGTDGTTVFRFSTRPPPKMLVVSADNFACTEPGPTRFAREEIVQNGIVGNLIDVPLCRPHHMAIAGQKEFWAPARPYGAIGR